MSTVYIREQGQLVPLSISEYKGDRGEAGQTPDLQVGSVTTLPSNQQASVTIQGDKENPTINFEIPSGTTGDKGLYVGRPDDAYDETKVVFNDENWVDDTYFKNSTVDYMGGEHESLKEKSDSDVEYILRKFGTQHYEGTNVTATNTYAMRVKSAMFKGRTLANLAGKPISVYKANTVDMVFKYENSPYLNRSLPIKPNTTYTIINFNEKKISVVGLYTKDNRYVTSITVKGNSVVKHTTSETTEIINFLCRNTEGWTEEEMLSGNNIVLLEGDYTNQNIPYFEGMKSVKSPSLVSVGKNLWNDNFEIGSLSAKEGNTFETTRVRTVNYIKVKPSTTYKIKDFGGFLTRFCIQYDKDKRYVSEDGVADLEVRTVVTRVNTEYIRFTLIKADHKDFTEEELQLIQCMMVEGKTNPTEYEPHKSHTLTTPSDLELRSNGNVYDELDLITGKLTQRIGEDGAILTQEVVKTIDLKGQKVYSYDGTTHYITSSLQGHSNPILSIDAPTNITSLLKHQQNTINRQRLVLSEREEMQNILIESMLYRYEQSTLLNDTIEVVPDYIQKLYEVAYQRGIRFRKEE